MDNRRIYDAFCRISQILGSSKGVEGITENFANLITFELNFRRCIIILKGESGEFCISALSGFERNREIEFLYMRCPEDSTSFISHILMNKKTIAVDTLPDNLRMSEKRAKYVVSPLIIGGKGIGVIIAEADTVGETDIELMESIARYASAGIENHNLYRDRMEGHMEFVHEIETLHLMYEIGKEILSNLNTEEIVKTAIQMIRRVIPCDGAAVALLNEEKNNFSVTASWGSGMEEGTAIERADAPFFALLENGKTFYQHDITHDFKDYPAQLEWASEKNVFSYFCVPLTVKDNFLGILILSSVRPAWFSKLHITTAERISTQVGIALENARLLEGIEDIFMGTVRSLVSAIDAKSAWTKGHSVRVSEYAVRLGEKLRLSKEALERLQLAAILHDIGKLGTYESILDKAGKLTDDEIRLIRKHPSQGAEILAPLKAMRQIIPIMKHHHERYDGSGYPDGLAGDDIPFEARILAIADVYDAMRSDRPYRQRLTHEEAVEELKSGAGAQFDPLLVNLFLDTINVKQM